MGYQTLTQQVSALRAKLALAAAPSPASSYDNTPDDYGLTPGTITVTLGSGSAVPRTQIVDADPTSVVAFARTTTQVLNIVTGGNATTAGTTAKGVFFPNGLNGLFS
jgi:hypothetical protein